MGLRDRYKELKHAWNVFVNFEQNRQPSYGNYGASYGSRPDRIRSYVSNERSIISSVYTRLSVDVAMSQFRHVRVDEDDRFVEIIPSQLNDCLKLRANIDQSAQDLFQEVAFTLFDKGSCAIVPVDTTFDPNVSGSYDIQSMRVGEIIEWYAEHVKVRVWNQKYQRRDDIILAKRYVGVIYNPFAAVMNEPSSTLQRLLRKLQLLDVVDEQSSSGKLDVIIQLPYVIKSEAKRQQADQRRKDLEFQLQGSKYGVAYADATEKITQLNRPAENNLMNQVEYLMALLFSQLGITQGILDGTADQQTMLNYHNRTVQPILNAITQALRWAFLTKTGRTQGQSVKSFRDPFAFVPLTEMAEIGDKFTRNEILSANELRAFMGIKPSKDPKADELRNSNMPAPSEPVPSTNPTEGDLQNGA